MRLDRARFTGDVRLSGVTFAGDVSLDGARFDRLASFFGARFEGNVSLAGVRFTRELSFHGVTARGHVSLDRAVMSRDALFSQAVFGHGLSCERARFDGYATFDGARLGDGAAFRGALRPYAVVPQGQRARRVRGGALRRGRLPVGHRAALGGQGARRRTARRGGRAVRGRPAAPGGAGPHDRAADGLAGRPGGSGAARTRHRHGAGQVHADVAAAGRRGQPGAVRAGPVGVPVRGAGPSCRGAGEGVHVRAHAARGAGEHAVADGAVVLAAAGAGRRAHPARPRRRSRRPRRLPDRLAALYAGLRPSDSATSADFAFAAMEMRRQAGHGWWLSVSWLLCGYGMRMGRAAVWLALVMALMAAAVAWSSASHAGHRPGTVGPALHP
ncbi:pentapeptide repeat-containing protein [Nonomuraea thailandensis]